MNSSSAGPLVRVQIVRIARDHHVVIWTAHHIVCDGWSCGLVIHELGTIYSALKQGVTPSLEVPGVIRAVRQGWAERRERGGCHSLLASTICRAARTAGLAHRSLPSESPYRFCIDSKTQSRYCAAAGCETCCWAQQRTTQVVLLMAALKTLLYRLTGQSDQVVGLGVAGQALKDQSNLVGHCVNLLPIRTYLRPEASFQEYPCRRKEECAGRLRSSPDDARRHSAAPQGSSVIEPPAACGSHFQR